MKSEGKRGLGESSCRVVAGETDKKYHFPVEYSVTEQTRWVPEVEFPFVFPKTPQNLINYLLKGRVPWVFCWSDPVHLRLNRQVQWPRTYPGAFQFWTPAVLLSGPSVLFTWHNSSSPNLRFYNRHFVCFVSYHPTPPSCPTSFELRTMALVFFFLLSAKVYLFCLCRCKGIFQRVVSPGTRK